MTTRRLGIALSGLLLANSAAGLLFHYWTQDVARAQAACCRFLPCSDRLSSYARRLLWRPLSGGAEIALPHFQEALRRDPASPYRWCDLAEAYFQAARSEQAHYCFQQAVKRGPHIPAVLLRAANFHFSVGEQPRALELGARCLAAFRGYDEVIFRQYLRMDADLAEILRDGMPRERQVTRSFFDYLLWSKSEPKLKQAWAWLRAHSLVDAQLLSRYISFLLREGNYDEAAAVQAAFLGTESGRRNRLFNAGFERESTESPLDWRIYPVEHAGARRDAQNARQGRWSLRIDFDGQENLLYRHVSQKAVVRRGRFRFRAAVHSQGLTTDQGVGFRIWDTQDWRRLDISTAQVTGTSDWQTIEKHFTVPRQTRLVEIQVMRKPSWKFDNKLAGTVWIDDVSLTRE